MTSSGAWIGWFCMAKSKSLIEKLYSRLEIKDPDACWLWTGPVNHDGYARVWQDGRAMRAHVVAWMDRTGRKVWKNHELDHKCEVRRCVNPAHMDHVRHSTNMRRIHKRPRSASV